MKEKRKYNPDAKLNDFWGIIIIIAVSCFIGFLIDVSSSPSCYKGEIQRGSLGGYAQLRCVATPANVWHYIRNHPDLLFDSLVYKKVINETGLKTKWLLAQNNLTCMRLPKKRKTTAIGEKHGYAVYSTWQSCIDDYALFQKMFHGKTIDDYYNFLQTYGDSNYVHNLKTNKITFPK